MPIEYCLVGQVAGGNIITGNKNSTGGKENCGTGEQLLTMLRSL